MDKIFELLSRRFGTGVTSNHARAAFNSRKQRPQESVSAFPDNLEDLRVRAFPREPKDERNLEILLKFRDGVSNPGLHNMLLIKYSDEEFAMKPPPWNNYGMWLMSSCVTRMPIETRITEVINRNLMLK